MKYLSLVLATVLASSIANAENYGGHWRGSEVRNSNTCGGLTTAATATFNWYFRQKGRTIMTVFRNRTFSGKVTDTGFRLRLVFKPRDARCTQISRQSFIYIGRNKLQASDSETVSCTDGYYCAFRYAGTLKRISQ
jgi:hypothetical protein